VLRDFEVVPARAPQLFFQLSQKDLKMPKFFRGRGYETGTYAGSFVGQPLQGRSPRGIPVVVPRGGISPVTLRPQGLALGLPIRQLNERTVSDCAVDSLHSA